MRRSQHEQGVLTPAELEVMQPLWEMGEGSVRDVLAAAPDGRAYTTVATILKILEQKGFAASRRVGRTLIYAPTGPRADFETRNLAHVVGTVFEGQPSRLVRRLIDADDISDGELDEIEAMLAARRAR